MPCFRVRVSIRAKTLDRGLGLWVMIRARSRAEAGLAGMGWGGACPGLAWAFLACPSSKLYSGLDFPGLAVYNITGYIQDINFISCPFLAWPFMS
jgi:hypothetical protein